MMTTKQQRLAAKTAGVGSGRAGRSGRKAFQVLAGDVSEAASAQGPGEVSGNVPGDVSGDVSGSANAASEPVHASERVIKAAESLSEPFSAPTAQSTGSSTARRSTAATGRGSGIVPEWTTLCTPAARRGTAGQQRRFNIPIAYSVLNRINDIDAHQAETHQHPLNRSALFEAAVSTYAHNPAYWVGQWEAANPAPATTSLQGRVSDTTYARIRQLRYLQEGDLKRSVNPGPVLALIIWRILHSPDGPGAS